MLSALIFDFGKVLVDYDFDLFFTRYVPDPVRRAAFAPLLFNEQVQQLLDREERPFDEIVDGLIAQHPDFEAEINNFRNHYDEVVLGEVAGMRELLMRLKAEGFRLYGLTNWCSKVYTTMAQYDIFHLLDGQVISSEEKVIKPEPEIYQRLFDRFGLRPEECFFADDREENIAAARALGMEGHVFTTAARYESALRAVL